MKFIFPEKKPSLISNEIPVTNQFTTEPSLKEEPKTEEDFPHCKKVSYYLVGSCLGEGSFAKVRTGLHVPTKQKVAIKVINKQKAMSDSYVFKNLHREGKLMQLVQHHNIVKLLDVLETENNYYLVTELCTGGDLINLLGKKGHLPETLTRKYVQQIVNAVTYLHSKKIVHRDLKIENILLDSDGNVKIIDFGLSNMILSSNRDTSRSLKTQCGSPAYAAPELLANQNYGPKVDVWSIGVITFCLATGKLPFSVKPFNLFKLCKKMIQRDMEQFSDGTSQLCRSFVRYLLTPTQSFRPSINDVAQHDWLTSEIKLDHIGYPSKFQRSRSDCCGDAQSSSLPPEVHLSVIKEMKEKFGFKYSDILSCIQRNKPGAVLATYRLLLSRDKVLQTESSDTDNYVKKTSQSNLEEKDDSSNKSLKIVANLTRTDNDNKTVIEKLPFDERSTLPQNNCNLTNNPQKLLENNQCLIKTNEGKPSNKAQEMHSTNRDKSDVHEPKSEKPKAISDEVSLTNNNSENIVLPREKIQTCFRLRNYRPLVAHFKVPLSLSASPTPPKLKQNQEPLNFFAKSEKKACPKLGASSLLRKSLPKLKSPDTKKERKTSIEILSKSKETLRPQVITQGKSESHYPTRPKCMLNRKSESKKFKPTPPLREVNLFSKRWLKIYSDKESPSTFVSKYNQYIKLCTKHSLPSITKPKKSISVPIAAAISRFTTSKSVGINAGERRQN